MIAKTLAKSIREYKWQTIVTPICVTAEVGLDCVIPLIMSKLVDSIDNLNSIFMYGGILLIMAFLSLCFGVLAGKTCAISSCGFAKNLRQDLFYRVQDFSFADIDKFSMASLVTRLTTDVTNVQNAFQMLIRIAVRSPLMIVFSFAMACTLNWKLAMMFVVIIPFLAGALFLIIFKIMPYFKKIFKKYDNLNNSVQENITGIRVVKSYVREDYEKEKFEKASSEVRDDFYRAEKILALNGPIMTFFIYAMMICVAFFGASLIIKTGETEFTRGELTALINYAMHILMAIMMFSMVFVMVSISAESAKRIAEVINQEPSLVGKENGEKIIADGSIDFDNVSFKYSEKAEKMALADIDLHIKSGETIGIIGGTGSSKTTLIQLVSRLYDATEGTVKVGGKDVREYDLTALRDSVSVVLQKNVLFSGTVRENLLWGNKDATDEEIKRCCDIAQASEFIEQLDGKYDAHIEQGGTNVSGGQKQRLCIARALLKKPKVIIFDDSTSAVDTKTDALIRKGLSEDMPHVTKIIIAQRVSSVSDADRIIVMDKGKIVEIGTHDELIALDGIYRDINDSQIKGREGSDNE